VSLEKFEELKPFEVFPGDLLVTTRGTIGRCMVVPRGAEKGILHPCHMRLQLNETHIADRYLELLIEESGFVLDQLKLMSNATTIEVIYSESLKEVWLAVPPLNEQIKIIEYFDEQTSRIDTLVDKVDTAVVLLTEYRHALITSAVTGKIDVGSFQDDQ
jgi:type I restriction enzyme S subunit